MYRNDVDARKSNLEKAAETALAAAVKSLPARFSSLKVSNFLHSFEELSPAEKVAASEAISSKLGQHEVSLFAQQPSAALRSLVRMEPAALMLNMPLATLRDIRFKSRPRGTQKLKTNTYLRFNHAFKKLGGSVYVDVAVFMSILGEEHGQENVDSVGENL
jgi:hypothetical protein